MFRKSRRVHGSVYGLSTALVLCLSFIASDRLLAQGSREDFRYVCSVSPYGDQKLTVTARGDDNSEIKGTVNTPSKKYYLVGFDLRKGVNYTVEFKLGDKVFTDEKVYHARMDPTTNQVQHLSLEGTAPKMVHGPAGMVLLIAKTQNEDYDHDHFPDVRVKATDGGRSIVSAGDTKGGTAMRFMEQGKSYTVDYYVHDKYYEKADVVKSTDGIAYWTLKDMGAISNPCKYTYTAYGPCIGGKKYRTPTGATPEGCDQTIIPPITDTVCVPQPPPPPETPCLSFVYSTWSGCAGGRQARTFTASPAGCKGQPPADSLSRSCKGGTTTAVVDDPGIPLISNGSSGANPDSCQVRAGLVVYYYPVMYEAQSRNVRVVVSKALLDSLSNTAINRSADHPVDQEDTMGLAILVHERVFVLLTGDKEVFAIDPLPGNDTADFNGHEEIEFTWAVKPLKTAENVTLTVTPFSRDCRGKMHKSPSQQGSVKVKIYFRGWWEKLMDDPMKAISYLGGLLAGISAILGYFKGWFKRKEKGESAAAT